MSVFEDILMVLSMWTNASSLLAHECAKAGVVHVMSSVLIAIHKLDEVCKYTDICSKYMIHVHPMSHFID